MRLFRFTGPRAAAAPGRLARRSAGAVLAFLTLLPLVVPAVLSAGRAGHDEAPVALLTPKQAVPQVDARFVALGRSYLPALGRAYAAAWIEGAKALEAGQAVDASLQAVSRSWQAGRQAAFDRWLTPQLGQIVPEGQADDATTPAQKRALAAAWRGLARGLDPQSN